MKTKKARVFHVPFKPFGFEKGAACYWFILINKKYKGDEALVKHEEVHIHQQHKIGLIKYLWEYFVKKNQQFILEMEFEAFIVDGRYSKDKIATILMDNYYLPTKLVLDYVYQ